MRERDFLHKLRRGLGSAIIELQENPNRTKYRDIVLRCCLKDIGYDTQSEGTKGYYLYTAICALGEKNECEGILIDAFMKRLPNHFFSQLADILNMYAYDGSQRSIAALNCKYQVLCEKLCKQKTISYRYCEREQFEDLMIRQVDFGQWVAFKKCIQDAGTIIIARKNDRYYNYCSCGWFINHCENVFGKKRVWGYLESARAASPAVEAFARAHAELHEWSPRPRIEQEVTLASYAARAKELENTEYGYGRMHSVARPFSRHASSDDLRELVKIIIAEPSDQVRANLLRVFEYVDFPGDLGYLMSYVEGESQMLRHGSIEALTRFSDQRVHDFAVELIEKGEVELGLSLLINNWHKSDETLLRQKMLASKKVSHSVQMDVRKIYSTQRSHSCGDILEHVYENGECSYCRSSIVEAMAKNHVLTDSIVQECRFDSYDETRKYAERIIRRKARSTSHSAS